MEPIKEVAQTTEVAPVEGERGNVSGIAAGTPTGTTGANRAVELGTELFKKLVADTSPKDQESVILLVNAAVFFLCCVQNNFYAYENRDTFADSLAAVLKNNKWQAKKDEAPQTSQSPAESGTGQAAASATP